MNLRQRVSVCVAKQRLLQKREPQRAQVYLGGGEIKTSQPTGNCQTLRAFCKLQMLQAVGWENKGQTIQFSHHSRLTATRSRRPSRTSARRRAWRGPRQR